PIRTAALTVLGFAVAAGAVCALLLGMGIAPGGMLQQEIGPSYPHRYETVWLVLFPAQCPIVVPAILVPFLPGAWSRAVVRTAACFGVASCLPFYFRQHQYYFLNLCPWLFILFAAGVQMVALRAVRRRAWVWTSAAILLVSIPLRAAPSYARLF